MDDPLEKMIEKGWLQMSKSLDDTMPVSRFSHFQRYRYYYSTALIFFMVMLSVVWFDDGTFIRNSSTVFLNKNISDKQSQMSDDDNLNKVATPYLIENKAFVIDDYIKSGAFVTENGILSDSKDISYGMDGDIAWINKKIVKSVEPLPGDINSEISNSLSEEINTRLTANIEKKISENPGTKSDDIVRTQPGSDDFKHNTISISVNSINEDLKSFGGIDGGISYAYRLNKSFGFMTGIEHSLFSRNKMSYDLQNFQKAVSSSENDNTGLSGMEQNVNTNNEKLYYVGIPLGFLYSIDKFTISAGVKFSYLVSATDYAGSYSREDQQAMALIKDVTANETGSYNKFDYSFIFGFEFHVLKDFSVFSRFNYAYSSMINSYSYNENPIGDLFIVSGLENNLKDKPDKNIYFGLGIKYDLAKK